MKELIDLIWGCPAPKFTVNLLVWLLCGYGVYQIHTEINMWRTERIHKSMQKRARFG